MFNVNVCVAQAYHDVWIGMLLVTHLRMVMVNTTTYESIKGRRWVDNTTHGKPFYERYPTNCFRFFFRPGGESGRMASAYGRVPNKVRQMRPLWPRCHDSRTSIRCRCRAAVGLFQWYINSSASLRGKGGRRCIVGAPVFGCRSTGKFVHTTLSRWQLCRHLCITTAFVAV